MLEHQRIVLITGKGGVGRTSVTVAMARTFVARGERVLVCEIADPEGGYSALGRHFARETLPSDPILLESNLWGCHLEGTVGHETFLRSILPAGPLIRAALRSKALSKFLLAAPSFHEMGIFYHLLTLLDARGAQGPLYPKILVDMPATGHTLALTGLPEILLRLIPAGPIAREMRRGQDYLNNPKTGAAVVVTLPEQLPVTEALELCQGLNDTSMPLAAVILNRVPKNPFTSAEIQALRSYLTGTLGTLSLDALDHAAEAVQRLQSQLSVPLYSLPMLDLEGKALDQALTEQLKVAQPLKLAAKEAIA